MTLQDRRTKILRAQLCELTDVSGPVARRLEAERRQAGGSTRVVIVTIQNEAQESTTLVVDSAWLEFAAESLANRPDLADELKLPAGAVVAQLPTAEILLDPPTGLEPSWDQIDGVLLLGTSTRVR